MSASLLSIDSVELNPAVISHGMLDSNGMLESVLADSSFRLIHDDARLYLEKSTKKYDTILFSWSGATVAHYSGALMHTTQYAFTREAMQAAINRLSDDGFLIIFGASKINLITHFRELNIAELEKKIILLEAQNGKGWKNSWDDHILIFSKKSLHHDPALLAELSRVSEENQYAVALFPEKDTSLEYQGHVDLIKEDNWTSALEKLREDNGVYFQSHTDDKPFVYSCCQFFSFSSGFDFIASVKKLFLFSNGVNYHNCIGFILLIICVYLFLNRKNSLTQKSNWNLSFLSGFLSGFFNFFLFYKAILYLGFPNYALVLSVMTASIANYSSLIFLNKKSLNIHLLSLFLISYMPLFIYFGILQMNYFNEILFEFPSYVKIFFLASFLPAIFFNSLIYNCLFFKTIHDSHFLENVVIFDTLGGCLSVLLTPMLVNDFGMMNSLLGVSVFFFLLLWLASPKDFRLQINKSSIL